MDKHSGTYVFLDRDGVINRDSVNYIKSWEEFDFLPGSLEAFRLFAEHRFPVILITNQSIINRNMVSRQELERIFTNMKKTVQDNGGRISDIFYCPHRPDENCPCRKPRPGLIEMACRRHSVNLSRSVMIGDSAKDVECAVRAGCGTTVLVRTGNGAAAEKALKGTAYEPSHVADNLLAAAHWIIQHLGAGMKAP